jgi:release factor glutamine methyltransferase
MMWHNVTTVRDALTVANTILQSTSPTARLDADLLLSHVCACRREYLVAAHHQCITPEQVTQFSELVTQRARRVPVAYLLGQREFFGLPLLVDWRVLVPRPETEQVVEQALVMVDRLWQHVPDGGFRIADIGTGSGAIAIALAVALRNKVITQAPTRGNGALHLYATDISLDALEVAAENIAHHHVQDIVTLLHGDLFSVLPERVNMVVSNPPYTILHNIDEGVYQHEPHLALDGGVDGLALYRRMLQQAPQWLTSPGGIVLEIDDGQAQAISAMVRDAFADAEITVLHDLAGFERVVIASISSHTIC